MCINYARIELWYRQLGNREGKKLDVAPKTSHLTSLIGREHAVTNVQKCKKHVQSV